MVGSKRCVSPSLTSRPRGKRCSECDRKTEWQSDTVCVCAFAGTPSNRERESMHGLSSGTAEIAGSSHLPRENERKVWPAPFGQREGDDITVQSPGISPLSEASVHTDKPGEEKQGRNRSKTCDFSAQRKRSTTFETTRHLPATKTTGSSDDETETVSPLGMSKMSRASSQKSLAAPKMNLARVRSTTKSFDELASQSHQRHLARSRSEKMCTSLDAKVPGSAATRVRLSSITSVSRNRARTSSGAAWSGKGRSRRPSVLGPVNMMGSYDSQDSDGNGRAAIKRLAGKAAVSKIPLRDAVKAVVYAPDGSSVTCACLNSSSQLCSIESVAFATGESQDGTIEGNQAGGGSSPIDNEKRFIAPPEFAFNVLGLSVTKSTKLAISFVTAPAKAKKKKPNRGETDCAYIVEASPVLPKCIAFVDIDRWEEGDQLSVSHMLSCEKFGAPTVGAFSSCQQWFACASEDNKLSLIKVNKKQFAFTFDRHSRGKLLDVEPKTDASVINQARALFLHFFPAEAVFAEEFAHQASFPPVAMLEQSV